MRSRAMGASVAIVLVLGLLLSVPGGIGQASAADSPITLAYVTSLTGEAAPQFAGSQAGFIARIDQQNALGGVNGHKLVPLVIDDQTSPSAIATAVQEADSRAFGIVSVSQLFFLAAKYPNEQGVPVTGSYTDGPEWGERPYTNMFSSDHGSVDPKYPVNTLTGSFLKQHGGTVIGTYGYSIAPLSAASARGSAASFHDAGGKIGVDDTSVPLDTTDFTAKALVAKQQGVNAIVPSLQNNSNFALVTALDQAGVKLKATLFPTGYDPAVIHSPVWTSVQGDYFVSLFRPFQVPNTGTEQEQAALERYASFTKAQFPTYSQTEAWLGADLMIKGLQMAGANPSRAAVIKDMRSIKAYNGNGLLPVTINYSTIFGHDPPSCGWVLKAERSGFVPISTQPSCGHDVPGTTTTSAS
jgi:branched-chain amino acid transport system substrate-binding protein